MVEIEGTCKPYSMDSIIYVLTIDCVKVHYEPTADEILQTNNWMEISSYTVEDKRFKTQFELDRRESRYLHYNECYNLMKCHG